MKRALAAAITLGALVLVAAPVSAASAVESGWWTRSPAASAPEGGLAVSNAPDGPVSVGAVRVDLGSSGVTSGTLSIPQTGGAAPTAAGIVVCIVDAQWKAVAAGAMADAPATTCTGTSAALTANGTTWSADVRDLVGSRTGTVAFAIVPASGGGGVWEVQFDTPAFQGTAAATPTSRPTVTTAPRATPTTVAATAPRPASPSFSVPRPPVVAVTTTTAAITPTTVNNFVANVAPSNEVAFGGASTDAGKADGRPIGQAVTMLVLAAVVGVLGGVAHKVVTARLVA